MAGVVRARVRLLESPSTVASGRTVQHRHVSRRNTLSCSSPLVPSRIAMLTMMPLAPSRVPELIIPSHFVLRLQGKASLSL
jgi:hypothetical protein